MTETMTTDEPPAPVGGGLIRSGDRDLDRRARREYTVSAQTAYEVELDQPPQPATAPVVVDSPAVTGAVVDVAEGRRVPIIPPALHPANLPGTLRRAAGRWAHIAAFHTVRSPWYAVRLVGYALRGLMRVVGNQIAWWWVRNHFTLMQSAADAGERMEWARLHREIKSTRLWRGLVLTVEIAALALGVLYVRAGRVPPLVLTATGAVVLVVLARYGRPACRTLIGTAVVAPRFRKLNSDIVLRAYYAAGLGHPDRPGQQVSFGSQMARDGGGSHVLVDLPYGKGLDDAIAARAKIASGLDVTLSQVFITRDPTSHRRHRLWVADRDPLAIPAGRTPLLRLRPTDIWTPAPFGLDERGTPVHLSLMWNSILVGAQPRQGKTFSARLLALYAALDPYVRLSVFDGKGSPDWRRFALVADRYAFGLAMTRDGDPIEAFVAALREIKADVQDRYQRLSELPATVCPEGKLTRQIARDPGYGMPVRMVVIDEFQEYFDTPDPEVNKEIAQLLVFLVKVAPAAGVIVLGATQKPSGIGSGQVAQLFNAYRDNHQVRFSLRTGSWQVSDLVLGAGAYSEGHDSSTLLPQYKGVGILRGATDATPTVRTYLADQEDAEKILIAARTLREQAGTLTGQAAGQPMIRASRDVLTDVHTIMTGETGLHWQTIAERLATRVPEHYAEVTAETISAQLRALGVPSVGVKRDGINLKGARTDAVETAMTRRAITGA